MSSSSGDRGDTTRSVEEYQDYLLNAVQHYGMSLQLGQKHVYQALPRLLAMWLEFTSLSSEEMNCEESSIESDRLAEKQGKNDLDTRVTDRYDTVHTHTLSSFIYIYTSRSNEQDDQKSSFEDSRAFVLYCFTSAHITCRALQQ